MEIQKSSSSTIEDFPSMPIIDDETTKNEDETMDKTHNDEATKNADQTMDNTSTEYGGTVKTVDYIGPDDVEFHNVGPKELTSSDLIKINDDAEENEVNKKKQVTNSYSSPKVISGKNLSMMRQQCNLAEAGASGSVHKKAKKHKKRVRKHKCKRKNKSHKPKSPEIPKDDNDEVPFWRLFQMEVNNLSYDELSYELWIRSMTLNSTLLEKRKILRLLLRQEEELKLPAGKFFKLNFSQELSVCSEKLKLVDTEIQTINSVNMHVKFKKILTRLCHVENRLRRMSVQGASSNKDLYLLKQLCLVSLEMNENAYEIEKVTLAYKNQKYIDHVLAKVSFKAPEKKPVENTPTHSTDIPKCVVDKPILEVCSKDAQLDNNTSIVANEEFSQTEILSTMKRWSICYNGTTNVKDFQSIIETLRVLHNVSKEQLIAAASTFFKDDALLWYRSRKHIFHNWDYLISELVRNFSTVGDDEKIWKCISIRFQHENEKLIYYISCMEHLLQRLDYLPSEQERVNIIKKNLLAPIRAALIFHEIYTVDQLLKIGQSVEKCYWSENRYRF